MGQLGQTRRVGLSLRVSARYLNPHKMESATHRLAEQAKTQAELRRQIASLQAQLVDNPQVASVVHATPISPKRKHVEGTQLAPPTPSPSEPFWC